jgi:pantoate--beta-alanine ligase
MGAPVVDLTQDRRTSEVAPVSVGNWTEADEPPPPDLALRMRIVRTVPELRSELARARRDDLAVGLVPTMGAMHEGHLSLIRRARDQCGVVVVSLFVNPTQFNERADLERYPRDELRDAELAERAGADVLFAPEVDEVYPPGFATAVEVRDVSERLEGAVRGAEHFRGVATVVTKLLCMAMPDVAYFGQKDAQQVVVISRLVRDLNLPVRVEVCPTVREPDGLAMSSRNVLLDERAREQALALYWALRSIEDYAARGERRAARLLEAGHQRLAARGVHPEYLELVDPDTLERLEWLDRPALLAVAANVGATRLIDNLILQPVAVPTIAPDTEKAMTTCSA